MTANSLLSPLTGSASTFEGKVAMSAIVGGTAAELGGGKFANGAVSAAFVMMYNEAAHANEIERQAYLQRRALLIARDPNVPDEYRFKLLDTVVSDKLLYVENAWRRTANGLENVFGTADISSGIIRITSRSWNYWQDDVFSLGRQVDKTLLHEIKHLILGTPNHPGGRNHFDDDIKAMGY